MIAKGDFTLVDGDDIDYKDVDIGDQGEQELEQATNHAMYRDAKRLPKRMKVSFGNMVLEYKDIIRIRFRADHPGDVPPWEIKFEVTERTVKLRLRS